MYFKRTPADFSPLKDGLIFEFCCNEPCDVEAVIVDDLTKSEMGRIQIRSVENGTIDIAPYITKPASFTPIAIGQSRLQAVASGLYHVELYRLGNSTPQCSSRPTKISTNAFEDEQLPYLLTTMPQMRVIARGEYDNIGLYCESGARVLVNITSDVGDEIYLESTSTTGVFQLVFAADELSEDATSAKVEIFYKGEYLTEFAYIIQPRYTNGVRLAWRTVKGNIEQYTFPVISQGSASAIRNYTTTKDMAEQVLDSRLIKQLHLISDFEPRSTLDALAEIVAASEVWVVSPDSYRTSVVDAALQYDITNTIGRIEIDIVSERKEGSV